MGQMSAMVVFRGQVSEGIRCPIPDVVYRFAAVVFILAERRSATDPITLACCPTPLYCLLAINAAVNHSLLLLRRPALYAVH